MVDLAVLDTTRYGGELVLLVADGVLVYAEDQYDDEVCNCTYDVMFVADALSRVTGVAVKHVTVPRGVVDASKAKAPADGTPADGPIAHLLNWYQKKGKRRCRDS